MPLPAIAAPNLPIAFMPHFGKNTPTQTLDRLINTDALSASWFADSFLERVSVEQVQQLISELRNTLGALTAIAPVPQGYELTFEGGVVPASIHLDNEGKIDGLFFGVPEVPISLDEALQAFRNFPGQASLMVLELPPEAPPATTDTDVTPPAIANRVLAEFNPDQPLAVGSVFKLAVLAALQAAIADGTIAWDQVVPLDASWKSLPSGILQDWPTATPMTIQTLATLMISLSDNTATDALINLIGREQVEAWASRNQPFLTTREAFALKNPENSKQLEAFRKANVDQRRQRLAALDAAPLPDANLFADIPLALDVEWHFSARELCGLLAEVKDLPLMQVNPGVAKRQHWKTVAFKGGAEPGVVSMATALTAQDGTAYCVAAIGNNSAEAINEEAFIRLYEGILLGLES